MRKRFDCAGNSSSSSGTTSSKFPHVMMGVSPPSPGRMMGVDTYWYRGLCITGVPLKEVLGSETAPSPRPTANRVFWAAISTPVLRGWDRCEPVLPRPSSKSDLALPSHGTACGGGMHVEVTPAACCVASSTPAIRSLSLRFRATWSTIFRKAWLSSLVYRFRNFSNEIFPRSIFRCSSRSIFSRSSTLFPSPSHASTGVFHPFTSLRPSTLVSRTPLPHAIQDQL
mmetsp:Transcript_736/g.4658  ORF Transcript_736/g.4658 Transcript_736/m.4658 type:complete len:226 (-) Transcript_736:132-809(-)